jgi:hypothetical protein
MFVLALLCMSIVQVIPSSTVQDYATLVYVLRFSRSDYEKSFTPNLIKTHYTVDAHKR